MIGPTELLTVLSFALFSGGFLGLPLSVPPLPPDPVIERTAPDACLFHLATAGLAPAAADGANLTERMLADAEMREFLQQLGAELMRLGRGAAPMPPALTEDAATLLQAALTRPMAVTVERFRPPSSQGPLEIRATLVIRGGEMADQLDRAAGRVAEAFVEGAPPEIVWKPVTLGAGSWQQIVTKIGPISWGSNDGSLVIAIGPDALESLVDRMADAGRRAPAWKVELEKRLAVDRRSTLAFLDAAEAIRMLSSQAGPVEDRLAAVLEASGVAGLQTVGAVSGMTAEGVAARTWLGFRGPPSGLFAAPATGIGARPLARIPAEATLVQTWSLDLSKTLATVIDVAAAGDPAAADNLRASLEQFRAVAGFNLDADFLEPLGPDWTVMSVPLPGGMIPGVAIVAGVRDRERFARTHKALLGILRNAAANSEVQVTVRELPYRGRTLFCLEAAGEGIAMPITPTWCLTEDSLIITMSPQLMKTLLARDPAAAGIASLPEVKSALAGGEPALVGAIDPVSLLGSLCGLYEMAAPMARGMLRQQGLELDLPQLPRSAAIMPFARPQVTTIRHEADGILVESTGTVPLGPLTAGGGVLGVSPATTPVLVGLLLPAVQSARAAAKRASVQNDFKQVMLAMLMYESARGRLPSQAICDDAGRPLLSWRVAVLPFLEEGNLYQRFRLDEPWDSEHNLALLPLMPQVFGGADATPEQIREGLTTIQVLTGDGTLFPEPERGLRLGAVSDGTSNTVAIVEALPENAVPWTKPDDVEFDPEQPLAGIGNPRRQGLLFVAGFLDGAVRMLTPDVDPEDFRAVVTPSGGEVRRLDW